MREERQALAGLSQMRRFACVREGADFRLGELRFDQRCDGVMLCCGLLAGAEFAAVVEVHPVGDVLEAAPGALGLHLGEELVFAVEAALAVVADVVGVVEFVRVENVGRDAVRGGEGEGGGEFGARQGGGVGDDGQHPVAEHLMRDPGEVGGVGAAGVGDQHAFQPFDGRA